jgi:hypothetical protein
MKNYEIAELSRELLKYLKASPAIDVIIGCKLADFSIDIDEIFDGEKKRISIISEMQIDVIGSDMIGDGGIIDQEKFNYLPQEKKELFFSYNAAIQNIQNEEKEITLPDIGGFGKIAFCNDVTAYIVVKKYFKKYQKSD